MNFVGPLQISKKGNQYLIMAIDSNTLKAFAIPISKCSHEVTIDLLEDTM